MNDGEWNCRNCTSQIIAPSVEDIKFCPYCGWPDRDKGIKPDEDEIQPFEYFKEGDKLAAPTMLGEIAERRDCFELEDDLNDPNWYDKLKKLDKGESC